MSSPIAGDVVGLLRVLQFGDSMFPIGGFAFSNGVESAIEADVVRDADTLADFVGGVLQQLSGGDGVAVLCAHRAAGAADEELVVEVDRQVRLRKLNEEVRSMSERMGRKLAEAAVHLHCGPNTLAWLGHVRAGRSPGTYPVALGVLYADLGLGEQAAFATHQYGTAMMMISAAQRLMKLHHLDAHAVLFGCADDIHEQYREMSSRNLADMSTFLPEVDVLAARHVRAHVRMFMN